jgi:hypothetical protein
MDSNDDAASTEVLVQELNDLRSRAGNPATRDIARKIGRSQSAVADVLRGAGSRDTLRRVVAGLDGDVTVFDDLFTQSAASPSSRLGPQARPAQRVSAAPYAESSAMPGLLCRFCLEVNHARNLAITVIDGSAVCIDHFGIDSLGRAAK